MPKQQSPALAPKLALQRAFCLALYENPQVTFDAVSQSESVQSILNKNPSLQITAYSSFFLSLTDILPYDSTKDPAANLVDQRLHFDEKIKTLDKLIGDTSALPNTTATKAEPIVPMSTGDENFLNSYVVGPIVNVLKEFSYYANQVFSAIAAPGKNSLTLTTSVTTDSLLQDAQNAQAAWLKNLVISEKEDLTLKEEALAATKLTAILPQTPAKANLVQLDSNNTDFDQSHLKVMITSARALFQKTLTPSTENDPNDEAHKIQDQLTKDLPKLMTLADSAQRDISALNKKQETIIKHIILEAVETSSKRKENFANREAAIQQSLAPNQIDVATPVVTMLTSVLNPGTQDFELASLANINALADIVRSRYNEYANEYSPQLDLTTCQAAVLLTLQQWHPTTSQYTQEKPVNPEVRESLLGKETATQNASELLTAYQQAAYEQSEPGKQALARQQEIASYKQLLTNSGKLMPEQLENLSDPKLKSMVKSLISCSHKIEDARSKLTPSTSGLKPNIQSMLEQYDNNRIKIQRLCSDPDFIRLPPLFQQCVINVNALDKTRLDQDRKQETRNRAYDNLVNACLEKNDSLGVLKALKMIEISARQKSLFSRIGGDPSFIGVDNLDRLPDSAIKEALLAVYPHDDPDVVGGNNVIDLAKLQLLQSRVKAICNESEQSVAEDILSLDLKTTPMHAPTDLDDYLQQKQNDRALQAERDKVKEGYVAGRLITKMQKALQDGVNLPDEDREQLKKECLDSIQDTKEVCTLPEELHTEFIQTALDLGVTKQEIDKAMDTCRQNLYKNYSPNKKVVAHLILRMLSDATIQDSFFRTPPPPACKKYFSQVTEVAVVRAIEALNLSLPYTQYISAADAQEVYKEMQTTYPEDTSYVLFDDNIMGGAKMIMSLGQVYAKKDLDNKDPLNAVHKQIEKSALGTFLDPSFPANQQAELIEKIRKCENDYYQLETDSGTSSAEDIKQVEKEASEYMNRLVHATARAWGWDTSPSEHRTGKEAEEYTLALERAKNTVCSLHGLEPDFSSKKVQKNLEDLKTLKQYYSSVAPVLTQPGPANYFTTITSLLDDLPRIHSEFENDFALTDPLDKALARCILLTLVEKETKLKVIGNLFPSSQKQVIQNSSVKKIQLKDLNIDLPSNPSLESYYSKRFDAVRQKIADRILEDRPLIINPKNDKQEIETRLPPVNLLQAYSNLTSELSGPAPTTSLHNTIVAFLTDLTAKGLPEPSVVRTAPPVIGTVSVNQEQVDKEEERVALHEETILKERELDTVAVETLTTQVLALRDDITNKPGSNLSSEAFSLFDKEGPAALEERFNTLSSSEDNDEALASLIIDSKTRDNLNAYRGLRLLRDDFNTKLSYFDAPDSLEQQVKRHQNTLGEMQDNLIATVFRGGIPEPFNSLDKNSLADAFLTLALTDKDEKPIELHANRSINSLLNKLKVPIDNRNALFSAFQKLLSPNGAADNTAPSFQDTLVSFLQEHQKGYEDTKKLFDQSSAQQTLLSESPDQYLRDARVTVDAVLKAKDLIDGAMQACRQDYSPSGIPTVEAMHNQQELANLNDALVSMQVQYQEYHDQVSKQGVSASPPPLSRKWQAALSQLQSSYDALTNKPKLTTQEREAYQKERTRLEQVASFTGFCIRASNQPHAYTPSSAHPTNLTLLHQQLLTLAILKRAQSVHNSDHTAGIQAFFAGTDLRFSQDAFNISPADLNGLDDYVKAIVTDACTSIIQQAPADEEVLPSSETSILSSSLEDYQKATLAPVTETLQNLKNAFPNEMIKASDIPAIIQKLSKVINQTGAEVGVPSLSSAVLGEQDINTSVVASIQGPTATFEKTCCEMIQNQGPLNDAQRAQIVLTLDAKQRQAREASTLGFLTIDQSSEGLTLNMPQDFSPPTEALPNILFALPLDSSSLLANDKTCRPETVQRIKDDMLKAISNPSLKEDITLTLTENAPRSREDFLAYVNNTLLAGPQDIDDDADFQMRYTATVVILQALEAQASAKSGIFSTVFGILGENGHRYIGPNIMKQLLEKQDAIATLVYSILPHPTTNPEKSVDAVQMAAATQKVQDILTELDRRFPTEKIEVPASIPFVSDERGLFRGIAKIPDSQQRANISKQYSDKPDKLVFITKRLWPSLDNNTLQTQVRSEIADPTGLTQEGTFIEQAGVFLADTFTNLYSAVSQIAPQPAAANANTDANANNDALTTTTTVSSRNPHQQIVTEKFRSHSAPVTKNPSVIAGEASIIPRAPSHNSYFSLDNTRDNTLAKGPLSLIRPHEYEITENGAQAYCENEGMLFVILSNTTPNSPIVQSFQEALASSFSLNTGQTPSVLQDAYAAKQSDPTFQETEGRLAKVTLESGNDPATISKVSMIPGVAAEGTELLLTMRDLGAFPSPGATFQLHDTPDGLTALKKWDKIQQTAKNLGIDLEASFVSLNNGRAEPALNNRFCIQYAADRLNPPRISGPN